MAIDNIKLGYLTDPFEQFSNINGKPLTNGWIEIYYAGTNTKYISYQNFDGTKNTFKIEIPTDGRVTILVDVSYSYDVYIYSANGSLVCSRLNVTPSQIGDISISGKDTILQSTDKSVEITLTTVSGNTNLYDLSVDVGTLTAVIHDNTLSGDGTSASPLGVSPTELLSVDDTLTAYTATTESGESLVLGVNGEFITSALSSKQDKLSNEQLSAISNVSSISSNLDEEIETREQHDETLASAIDKKQDKLTTEQINAISNVSSISSNLDKEIEDRAKADENLSDEIDKKQNALSNEQLSAISSVDNKLDTTAFSTVSGNFLTAHQSLEGLMSADKLELLDNKITGYNGTAFSAGSDGKTYEGIDPIVVNNDENKISANTAELTVGTGLSFDENNKISITATYGDMSASLLETNDEGKITAYNGTEFAGGGSEGKTYEGVSPIVVNNDENKISADVFTVVAGDGITITTADSTLTIASTATGTGDMKQSLLEYDSDNNISGYNGSAFAGKSYIGDSPIKIEDNTISVDSLVLEAGEGIGITYDDNFVTITNTATGSEGKTYTSPSRTIIVNNTNNTIEGTTSAVKEDLSQKDYFYILVNDTTGKTTGSFISTTTADLYKLTLSSNATTEINVSAITPNEKIYEATLTQMNPSIDFYLNTMPETGEYTILYSAANVNWNTINLVSYGITNSVVELQEKLTDYTPSVWNNVTAKQDILTDYTPDVWNEVTSKLDTTAFSTTSSTFMPVSGIQYVTTSAEATASNVLYVITGSN